METTISQQSKKMSAQNKAEIPNEMIEEQTKNIPNLVFLSLGLASMAGSLILFVTKRPKASNFVGQWVPTFLLFGLYNKIVKVEHELLKQRLH